MRIVGEKSFALTAATLPLAILLTGCAGAAEQPTKPEVKISRKTVETLYRTAFVGTEEKPGCLWGDPYDTDKHIGDDPASLPLNFRQALASVDRPVNTANEGTKIKIYPAQEAPVLEMWTTYADGMVTFMPNDKDSTDHLLSLGCRKITSIQYEK